ncbi:MAG: 1,4-dihydroxy-2-naphthoate octaprenyltransferase [Prevotella sp.]|nr:1,4-dihydroxy-2-naphthoate octaprenyltransferase [Prevotella sp.]
MNNNATIRTNSLRAWVLAARPKTLTGALTPVILGLALSLADLGYRLHAVPAVLCVLFALIMQVDANLVNDYFDWRKGNDNPDTRLGPPRACTMGWVTPGAMRRALVVVTTLACIVGLPLTLYGGWGMVLAGIACVVFCFLYTTVLSYLGLGDVLVVLFFGLVPVCLTYFLQTGTVNVWIIVLSVACGLVIDNLLIVNNYRDIDLDRNDGKRTLVVRLGRRASLALYFFIGFAATFVVFVYAGFDWRSFIMLIYVFCHCRAYRMLTRLRGRDLNAALAAAARNNLVFGLSASAVALL